MQICLLLYIRCLLPYGNTGQMYILKFCFYSRPGFSLQEALDMIFDEDEDTPKVYISPPDAHADTDEDSAEEDSGGTADNLSGRQLSAPAEVKRRKDSTEQINDNNDNKELLEGTVEDENDDVNRETIKQKSGISKKGGRNNTQRIWIDGDLESHSQFENPMNESLQSKSPIELFCQFFDNDIFTYILNETKKYAAYKNCPDPNISMSELKCFFGIMILSGYHALTSRRYYWDEHSDMAVEIVKNSMRRNRFEQIMRFIHFADNTQINVNDKMWKLRHLMTKLKENFLKYFPGTQHLDYDESMIKYFGRHSCKQFIRGKPIRFGYKVWCLNAGNGYLINFDVYQGKNCNPKAEQYSSEFGKATAPLVIMLDELPQKDLPYEIFIDNLFTSFSVLKELKNRGYGVTGTLRENRLPKDCPLIDKKAMAKQPRGYFASTISKDDGIIVVRWMDNAVVTVVSTSYGVQPITSVKRYSQTMKKIINVPRPNLIAQYNRFMGGTDRMDEDIARYRVGIRSKKWYWPIFTWLIDVSINNAWVLHRNSTPENKKIPNIMFRREIVQSLLRSHGTPANYPGRPSTSKTSSTDNRISDALRYDRIDHFVVPVPNRKRRRCAGEGCSSSGRTQCNKCDVGLCIECFKMFHTKL